MQEDFSSAHCVQIDETWFEIVNNHLVKFKPNNNFDLLCDTIILPECITSIGKNSFDISTNVVKIVIPPTVTFIDDNPFRFAKYVYIYGQPGSYAARYVRSHTGSLPTYEFISINYPDTIKLEENSQKARETKYHSSLQQRMQFETATTAAFVTATFPCDLFCVEKSSVCDEHDNIHSVMVTIKMQDEGHLVAEEKSITYSAHNVAHCTTPSIMTSDISFDELPDLIALSKDKKAEKYIGMNRENWKRYFKQSKTQRTPTNLPIVQFGRYPQNNDGSTEPIQWYVLDERDGYVLLLSRIGIEVCQYELDDNLMVYPNKGKKNYWKGAYKRRFDWQTSNLHCWLNSEFAEKTFLAEEIIHIKNDSLDCSGIFCLSIDEYNRYLYNDPASGMRPSSYALHKGAGILTNHDGKGSDPYLGNGVWWLRDPKTDENSQRAYANIVYANGKLGDTIVDFKDVCVRPAVWVSIDYWKNLE